MDLFNDGDFDLVVLGHSISIDDRERLTFLIRGCGSQTPVTFIGNSSRDFDSFAHAALKNDSSTLFTGLKELLVEESKIRVAPTILHGDVYRR